MEDHSHSDAFYDKLRRHVPSLVAELREHRDKQLPSVVNPMSKLEYSVLADAMYWEDELQGLPIEVDNAFRIVLNHRTSLLEGEDGRFPEVWQAAKECFPKWIGFLPERCAANAEIADRVARIRRVSDWKMKRWDADPGTDDASAE